MKRLIFVAALSAIVATLALLSGSPAFADMALIHDVENLRNSLPEQDPTRLTLTLRLADLLFNEAGHVTEGGNPTAAQQAQANRLRQQAITSYQEALEGSPEAGRAATGALKLKVQFQLARLYADLGKTEQALPLWKSLESQSGLPELKREAAIRLAENAEDRRDYAGSEGYYQEAISLCNGTDLCSYAHYRRAWLLKNQGRLDDAVSEIQLALFDSKGQVREEALRDLVSFLGQRPGDGKSEIALVENLIRKIPRPSLLSDLSASFFAAGNAAAGVNVLALLDSREPTVRGKIKLLEGYYGLRQWDAYRRTMQAVREMPEPAGFSSDIDSEKILKRLTVQLDGERSSQPQYTKDFENAVELHLALFPKTDALKMMEGWMAAEQDPSAKAAMIHRWLDSPAFGLGLAGQIELREARASLGQKLKDDAMVSEEMQVLSRITTDPAKRRQYRYVGARSLYALKRYNEALPVFVELAKVGPNSAPDQWAIQSQNLALDIYGQMKSYPLLEAQAASWTGSQQLQARARADSALGSELASMAAVAEKARFQAAAAGGETPASLATFVSFCTSGKLLPQSCENAKVLAVKLKDEAALLAVLRAQKSPELASEEEAAGYFAESAALLDQRLNSSSSLKDRLKVALLYELGGRIAERDRVLGGLLEAMRGQKSYGALEDLLYTTLADASLLTRKQLALAWNPAHRARLAEALEQSGRGNAETKEILLSSEQSTGSQWNALVVSRLDQLAAREAGIGFYGARSRAKFAVRLNALKKLVAFADKYLPGAPAGTRARMLETLQNSHAGLAQSIVQTPIPSAVQGDQLKQVQDALAKMAEPFQQKAKDYAELLRKDATQAGSDRVDVSQAAATAQSPAPAAASPAQAMEALHRDPADVTALTALKSHYLSTKQTRLADYFTGRIFQLLPKLQGTGAKHG